jgi:hypothetical protein
MTDPAPWDLPHGYGGPSRYRAQPDWEVHTTYHDGHRQFVLHNTATGHTEDLPSRSGLYLALYTAEARIAGHLGTTEHLSAKVLELLDDTDH